MNLGVIFITGLTVGGLTCLAVQGGLLASVIASRENSSPKLATLVFLIFKLIGYVILGAILGAFGGAINISAQVQSVMQLVAGLYMVVVALNLLEMHPVFRYFILQPPKFLVRLVRNQSKSSGQFAPAFLGLMTIFIPCGTTLAMEALAISSASPLIGALIMGTFILGTVPLFFGVGYITSIMGEAFKLKFLKIAGVMVFGLGVMSIWGAIIALGVPLAFRLPSQTTERQSVPTTQSAEIQITSRGYSPNYIRVKKGLPVTLTLTSRDAFSCASAFRIPSLGIAKNIQPNDSQVVTFTPAQVGKIQFTCSMGMYTGVIDVI